MGSWILSDRECRRCRAALPRQAAYCPRCGHQVDPSDLFRRGLPAKSRELILGWLFLCAGSLLVVAGLFLLGGVRTWMTIGFGIPLFVIGLGSLTENKESQKRNKKQRRLEKKLRKKHRAIEAK